MSAASTRRPSTELGDLSGSLTDEEQIPPPAACISPDMPSCASGMSGLDDSCLDAMLGDGIEGQALYDNMCYQELSSQGELEKASEKEQIIPYNVEDAVQALLANHCMMGEGTKKYVRQLRVDLNHRQSAWGRLKIERNLYVLTNLLFEWLEHLKSPILDRDDLSYIVILGSQPETCLKKLDLITQYTLEYLLRFLARLQPISNDTTEDIIKRFVCSLTHQSIAIQGILKPAGKSYQKLREGTYRKVMEFMIKVYDMVYDSINNQLSMSPDSPRRIEDMKQEEQSQ
ncbi:Protein of unknown function [Gryllus bimaculatus]|nr:Protein of unknown function [Gryllus bimaculatus]